MKVNFLSEDVCKYVWKLLICLFDTIHSVREHFTLEVKSESSTKPKKCKTTILLNVTSHYQFIEFKYVLIHSHAALSWFRQLNLRYDERGFRVVWRLGNLGDKIMVRWKSEHHTYANHMPWIAHERFGRRKPHAFIFSKQFFLFLVKYIYKHIYRKNLQPHPCKQIENLIQL